MRSLFSSSPFWFVSKDSHKSSSCPGPHRTLQRGLLSCPLERTPRTFPLYQSSSARADDGVRGAAAAAASACMHGCQAWSGHHGFALNECREELVETCKVSDADDTGASLQWVQLSWLITSGSRPARIRCTGHEAQSQWTSGSPSAGSRLDAGVEVRLAPVHQRVSAPPIFASLTTHNHGRQRCTQETKCSRSHSSARLVVRRALAHQPTGRDRRRISRLLLEGL